MQMMFVESNRDSAKAMAQIAAEIQADEVELNTPLRPCAVKPLSEEEMREIKKYFQDIPGVTMVYERERKSVEAIDIEQAKKRHGEYR